MIRWWHYRDFQFWRRSKVHSAFYLVLCHPSRTVDHICTTRYQFVNWTARFSTNRIYRAGWWCRGWFLFPRWLVAVGRRAAAGSELADRLYTLQHFRSTLFLSPLFGFSHYTYCCDCDLLKYVRYFIVSLTSFGGENSKFRPRFSTRTFCFAFSSGRFSITLPLHVLTNVNKIKEIRVGLFRWISR